MKQCRLAQCLRKLSPGETTVLSVVTMNANLGLSEKQQWGQRAIGTSQRKQVYTAYLRRPFPSLLSPEVASSSPTSPRLIGRHTTEWKQRPPVRSSRGRKNKKGSGKQIVSCKPDFSTQSLCRREVPVYSWTWYANYTFVDCAGRDSRQC